MGDTSGEEVARFLVEECKSISWGQGYDGAGNMSGQCKRAPHVTTDVLYSTIFSLCISQTSVASHAK